MSKNKIELLFNENVINQIPGYWGVQDIYSKFQLVNKTGSQWTSFKSPDAMIDLSYEHMPCKAAEDTALFVRQDKIALYKERITFIGYYCYAKEEWKLILGNKYVLKDEQNNVLGIVGHFDDYSKLNIIDISRFIVNSCGNSQRRNSTIQFCYLLDNNYLNYQLSTRESECLFFLLRGKTAKGIAKVN